MVAGGWSRVGRVEGGECGYTWQHSDPMVEIFRILSVWWMHSLHRERELHTHIQTSRAQTGKPNKVGELYRRQRLGCDIVLELCKMLPLGNWVKGMRSLSPSFLITASKSTMISQKV